jgi:3-oxoadipate enol-lactonase
MPIEARSIETARGAFDINDSGQGDALFFLHAFPLSRQMWRAQMESLQDAFHVIAPNLRGAGEVAPHMSTHAAGQSIESMADDVAAMLNALEIESTILCGLSIGGYIALAFARKYPERLNALVLADTRSEADSIEARAKRDEMIAFAKDHSSRETIEKMLPNLICETTRDEQPQVVEQIIEMASQARREGLISTLQALRDRPDATPQLGEITVPTLVIVGARDAITPPDVARDLTSKISGARLEIIEGAGHLSNLEQPERFNACVRDFLQSQAAEK